MSPAALIVEIDGRLLDTERIALAVLAGSARELGPWMRYHRASSPEPRPQASHMLLLSQTLSARQISAPPSPPERGR